MAFWALSLSAQSTEIKYPTTNEFKTYLNERSTQLRQKLYQQCRDGFFTLYKTDSLKSQYDAATFKERGASSNATSDVLTPLSADDISGMWYTKTYSSPFNAAEENDKLSALALMFQPMLAGYLLPNQPLVWLSMDELKTKLTVDDYQFLVYMGKFAAASNSFMIWENDDLPYFDLLERQYSFVMCDTLTQHNMSKMLESGQKYIDLIRFNANSLTNKDKLMIMDEQSKRQISLVDIGNTYQQKLVAFISTDENDPTKGYDTTFMDPQYIRQIDQLVYDATSAKVTMMKSQLNTEGLKVANFTIPRAVYENYQPGRHILWFLDDYVRWHSKRSVKAKK
jgi:hypothetical protein